MHKMLYHLYCKSRNISGTHLPLQTLKLEYMDSKPTKDVALNMRLPAYLLERAKEQADKRGLSLAALIRMLLTQPTYGLFYHQPGSVSVWLSLPATSQHLSDRGIAPGIGDRVTLLKADHPRISSGADGTIPPEDFYKTVVTVTERIHGYLHYDIAFLCEYKPF
jgi:predicted DNA binding CopG/RHH family protein